MFISRCFGFSGMMIGPKLCWNSNSMQAWSCRSNNAVIYLNRNINSDYHLDSSFTSKRKKMAKNTFAPNHSLKSPYRQSIKECFKISAWQSV